MRPGDWIDDAACAAAVNEGRALADWWTDWRTKGALEARIAARICSTCPVQQPCGEYGVRTRSRGVFGGVAMTGDNQPTGAYKATTKRR